MEAHARRIDGRKKNLGPDFLSPAQSSCCPAAPSHQSHQSRHWLPSVQRSWQDLDARPSFPASLNQRGTRKARLPASNMVASQPHPAPAWNSGLVNFPLCPAFPHPPVCRLTELWGVTTGTIYVTRLEQCLAHISQCQLLEMLSLPSRLPNVPDHSVATPPRPEFYE